MADFVSLSMKINEYQDQLSIQIAEDRLNFPPALESLERARFFGAAALVQDIEAASVDKIEDKIWNAHLKLNAKLREGFRKLKEGGNTRAVETRKAAGDYLKFIKTSQKHYRGLIRSLNAAYGGIIALQHVARELARNDDELRPQGQRQVTAVVEQQILRSCYRALIQLGDLSRYRESELADQKPNWGHAVGFYDLAKTLIPDAGVSYNQLAIVALGDGNLFQATYYLYRALSTVEPHPQAEANLRRAFYKISTAPERSDTSNASTTLVTWYLRLVSKCYHGKHSAEHEELENEVISQLQCQLDVSGHNTTSRKLFLVAFAGCHFAQQRFTKDPSIDDHLQSYLKFLRICIRSICALFKTFQKLSASFVETARSSLSRDNQDVTEHAEPILPLIRLAMIWSVKNQTVLFNSVSSDIDVLQAHYWRSLADCLNQAAVTCDLATLSDIDYMLEEDEDCIAFEPLVSTDTRPIWYNHAGLLRRRWHDRAEATNGESLEMRARMRYFLRVGMRSSTDARSPISYDLDQAIFIYRSDVSGKKIVPQILSRSDPSQADSHNNANRHNAVQLCQRDIDNQEADADAERMVSDLVGVDSLGSDAGDPGSPTDRPVDASGAMGKLDSEHVGDKIIKGSLGGTQHISPKIEVPKLSHRSLSGQSGSSLRPGSRDASAPNTLQSSTAITHPGHLGSPSLHAPTLLQRRTLKQPPGLESKYGPGPALMSRNASNHSRVQSNGSVASHQSALAPTSNGTWSSYHPTNSKENGVPTGPSTPTQRGTVTRTWTNEHSTPDSGMGNMLLFGAGHSPWNMTGEETKRLSTSSPRLPPSPALRHDSGTSSGSNNAGPAVTTPWRTFARPGS